MVERCTIDVPQISEPQNNFQEEPIFWKKGDLFIDGFLDKQLVAARIETLSLRKRRSDVSQAELKDLYEAQKIFQQLIEGKISEHEPKIITRKNEGKTDTLIGSYTIVFDDKRDYITLEKHKEKAKNYPQVKLNEEQFKKILILVKNTGGLPLWDIKSFLSPSGAIRWRSKTMIQAQNVSVLLRFYSKHLPDRHLLLHTGTHGVDGKTVFTHPRLLDDRRFRQDCDRFRSQDMEIVYLRRGIVFSVQELLHDDGTIENPEYPDNMDTVDCWCSSYLSPMWVEDFKKFSTGQFVQSKDKLIEKCSISYEEAHNLFDEIKDEGLEEIYQVKDFLQVKEFHDEKGFYGLYLDFMAGFTEKVEQLEVLNMLSNEFQICGLQIDFPEGDITAEVLKKVKEIENQQFCLKIFKLKFDNSQSNVVNSLKNTVLQDLPEQIEELSLGFIRTRLIDSAFKKYVKIICQHKGLKVLELTTSGSACTKVHLETFMKIVRKFVSREDSNIQASEEIDQRVKEILIKKVMKREIQISEIDFESEKLIEKLEQENKEKMQFNKQISSSKELEVQDKMIQPMQKLTQQKSISQQMQDQPKQMVSIRNIRFRHNNFDNSVKLGKCLESILGMKPTRRNGKKRLFYLTHYTAE